MLVQSVKTGPRRPFRRSCPVTTSSPPPVSLCLIEIFSAFQEQTGGEFLSLSLGLPQPQLQTQRLIRVPVRVWHWGCRYDRNYLLQGNSCQGCDNLQLHYRWSKDPFLFITFAAEPFQKYFFNVVYVTVFMWVYCLCTLSTFFWYLLYKTMTSGSTVHFIISTVTADLIISSLYLNKNCEL